MENRETQIEAMAKDYYGYSIDLADDCRFVAEEMFEKGHRKLLEGEVVISKEEWKQIKNSLYYSKKTLEKKLDKAIKETAEFWHDKIDTALLAMWKGDRLTTEQYNAWIIAFNGFAKQFGVEIKE